MKFSSEEETTYRKPPTYEELLEEYQKQHKKDPSSIYYERKLVRPKINFFKAISCCLISLILFLIVGIVLYCFFESIAVSILSGIFVLLIICIILAKAILIWFVHLYQRFASKERRERCRFEPSCSEYMILSLQKYGVVKGLKKGINRMKRCKPPNGGYDPP